MLHLLLIHSTCQNIFDSRYLLHFHIYHIEIRKLSDGNLMFDYFFDLFFAFFLDLILFLLDFVDGVGDAVGDFDILQLLHVNRQCVLTLIFSSQKNFLAKKFFAIQAHFFLLPFGVLNLKSSSSVQSDIEDGDEGNVEGNVEGDVEGGAVGNVEGDVDGDIEGNIEGDVDGNVEGDVDGDTDGDADGSDVGEGVGGGMTKTDLETITGIRPSVTVTCAL